ncbi:MAG: BON domain-containing protein [Sulfitobacter sp.]|nr:BON domain-containing protein [Sulfitobacter sp.]
MANQQYRENRHYENERGQYRQGASDWEDQRGPQRGQRQDRNPDLYRGPEGNEAYPDNSGVARQDRQYERPMRDERGGYQDDYMGAAGNEGREWGRGRADYGSRGGMDYRQGGDHYGSDGGGGHREDFGREMRDQPRDRDYGYRGGSQDQSARDQRGGLSSRFDGEGQGRSGQSHRGRGPKNYQRSDDRICDDVCDRLSDDHDVDASDIEVSVSDREVTLSGEVDSKQAKRSAEDCADSVSGVEHVQNNLRVKKSRTGEESSQDGKSKSKQ